MLVQTIIGHNIRVRRKELGYSQSDLAGLAEMSESQLRLIEHGKSNPTVYTLQNIAMALDIDFRDLFFLTGKEKSNNHPLMNKYTEELDKLPSSIQGLVVIAINTIFQLAKHSCKRM